LFSNTGSCSSTGMSNSSNTEILLASIQILLIQLYHRGKVHYPQSLYSVRNVSVDKRQKAGAAAAFTVDLLIYPLDTLKTRIQSQDYVKTYASTKPGTKAPALPLRGLYQGVGSVIVATLPAGMRLPVAFVYQRKNVDNLQPEYSSRCMSQPSRYWATHCRVTFHSH
jgi:hypothetical protein